MMISVIDIFRRFTVMTIGNGHYSYDYTEVGTCPNTARNMKTGNENNISDSKPVENTYDISSHVTNGPEYQTSTYISEY
jgi:hypothetical protein